MYEAEVLADSITTQGDRLTSVAVTYPHGVHKDMLRHRALSRVVESFRARPVHLLIAALEKDGAFRPEAFSKRVKGMGQGADLESDDQDKANRLWDYHVGASLHVARELAKLDVAKQQVNFVIQDLCPVVEILTATDWDNFFALRLDTDETGAPRARPEVFKATSAIQKAWSESTPTVVNEGQMHLPLVTQQEIEDLRYHPTDTAARISIGRCARVSYDKHRDPEPWSASIDRADRLLANGHMSPFEMCARPFTSEEHEGREKLREFINTLGWMSPQERRHLTDATFYLGNFRGWHQMRKDIIHEGNYRKLMRST
jgi:hypothetical protein